MSFSAVAKIIAVFNIFRMKYQLFIILIYINFLIACSPGSATDPSAEDQNPPDPFEVNSQLSPGINLGNALEAPNEGDWSVTIQDEYLEIIKGAGFNHVRIPIRWAAHAAVDSPYAIDPIFMNRVKHVVDVALENDLYTVINIHHYDAIFENPAVQKERFLSIWQQISATFQTYPSRLIFEVLNEPHNNLTPALWNQYFPQAIEITRKYNPYRTLVIGTAVWGGLTALNDLILPQEEQNLIVTIHYYEPFQFTHQGAEWVNGADVWLGTTWLGKTDEIIAIQNHFDQISTWADLQHRPIYIGEFGAYSRADMNSRRLWTGYVAKQCQQHGFSWAYWEFCSGFGAYDVTNNQWHQQLLDALIQTP